MVHLDIDRKIAFARNLQKTLEMALLESWGNVPIALSTMAEAARKWRVLQNWSKQREAKRIGKGKGQSTV